MALDYKSEYQRYKYYFTYLRPLAESPMARASFTVILTLITIAIFAAFAIRPTIATIISLQKEIAEKEVLSQELDTKMIAITTLSGDYQIIEPLLPRVFAALPQTPDVPQVVSYLEKTAAMTGMTLTNVAATKIDYEVAVASKSALSTVPVNLVLTGDFTKTRHFLDSLGRLPRLLTVTGVTMEKSLAASDENLTVKVAVSGYFLP